MSETGTFRPAFPVLVGDIGGTNARFGLLAAPDAPLEILSQVRTADHPDIDSAIATSLPEGTPRPRTAVVAVAGPIRPDGIDLTNAHWAIRPASMFAETGLEDIVLLNDFEAQALSLTALGPADLAPIGGGVADPSAAKVVLGPGTGLGVGALVPAGDRFAPVPGEGGHVSFGPVEPDEMALWPAIEPEHGRISAEALLCGRGILRLYRAVSLHAGVEPRCASPAEVTAAAAAGEAIALRTLEFYCRFLGRLAGDLALIFMARGGVFLAGGISPRILPFLAKGGFRQAFEAKARHGGVLAGIPTSVVIRDGAALVGLAAFAAAPDRFGVALTGRRWRASR